MVSEADAVTEHLGEYIVPQARAIAAATAPLIEGALPGMSASQRGDLREAAARAHESVGLQAGENEPIETALRAYRKAAGDYLTAGQRERWAMTQNNLGNALKTLGQREAGTARLEQAVDAYRAALEERTRDRVPLDWATTQNNLGNALQSLGERETGTGRLEEAVDAYRAALEERTRDRVPLQWAMTQGNLGNVYIAFFEKTGDAARLDTAEGHVQAALAVFRAAGASQYVGMAEGQLARIARLRSGG